ncbi:MAG: hypothetical protein ABJK37_22765 [Paraglaciecola sp.]|uniref:hypothetical protein n=1 Tax=Paraglaciecola sp. TaxID=1920173 RepID=UPI00329691CE
MAEQIFAVWIVFVAIADYFINDWITEVSRYIGSKLILAEWYDTGFIFLNLARTMESSGAAFIVGLILTLMAFASMDPESFREIDE